MDIKKRSTGFGAALIIFALLVRLAEPALAARETKLFRFLMGEGDGGFLRVTGTSLSAAETAPPPTTQPVQTQPPQQPAVTFSADDSGYIRIRYASDCAYRPDLQALLLRQLQWDLTNGEPAVLIVHSHASEAYSGQPDYRSTDTDRNMVAVGEELTRLLEAAGITVIHDRYLHDGASYNDAYASSRSAVENYLAQYPSIRLVLDLHRDAALNADGSQYATAAKVNGKAAAQVMFVIGTNASGTYHPDWQENLAIALKLQVLLEQQTSGITRPTVLRAQRFNQDVCDGAMIIEVGAAGNSLTEALRAMPALADAIIALSGGANTE